MIMWKRKIKLSVEQRNLVLEMMLLHNVFNEHDANLIEKVYATGYYTKEEQKLLNDIREHYIEYDKIYKVIDI
jgi:hypothetical protein